MRSTFPLYVVTQALGDISCWRESVSITDKEGNGTSLVNQQGSLGFFFLFCFLFFETESYHVTSCLGTCCVDQAGLQLTKSLCSLICWDLKPTMPGYVRVFLQDPWWHRLPYHWGAPVGMVYNSENLHYQSPLAQHAVSHSTDQQHPLLQWLFTACTASERCLGSLGNFMNFLNLKKCFLNFMNLCLSSGRECLNLEETTTQEEATYHYRLTVNTDKKNQAGCAKWTVIPVYIFLF